MNAKQTEAAVRIAFTALAVATGATPPAEGARIVMRSLPDLIPVDELKDFLTDGDRIFADIGADVAEQIKLDGSAER